jgi:hydrogenase maturation protein HypF
LLGLADHNRFEGQIPLALEAAAVAAGEPRPSCPFPLRAVVPGGGAEWEIDWEPGFEALRRHPGGDRGEWAAAFHHGLAEAIVAVAQAARTGTVALSGGCFQNTFLLRLATTALRRAGFTVLTHRQLPPNDGGIAAGQALGALWGLSSVHLP